QYLPARQFPSVTLGRTECAQPYAHVDGDGEAGFRLATERLQASGHRRITHLAAPSAFTFAGMRSRGYAAAMAVAGLQSRVIEDLASEEGGYRAASIALRATP